MDAAPDLDFAFSIRYALTPRPAAGAPRPPPAPPARRPAARARTRPRHSNTAG